ncbi:MAG: hypothetical protein EHM85_07220 [Desulfobacteraceae bacterium]|nr:MAG: hypothetical protein EHM85_07220 [Desulfobacteraceae bacterium]
MFDLKYLIVILIGIDFVLLGICVFLIRKIRLIPKAEVFEQGISLFESLIGDADKVSGQFKDQIRIKYNLIKKLSMQLDNRIDHLNVMLNRADTLLAKEIGLLQAGEQAESFSHRQNEIIEMAGKGFKVEEIANRLLIPKGEIKLVLDLVAVRKERLKE